MGGGGGGGGGREGSMFPCSHQNFACVLFFPNCIVFYLVVP